MFSLWGNENEISITLSSQKYIHTYILTQNHANKNIRSFVQITLEKFYKSES